MSAVRGVRAIASYILRHFREVKLTGTTDSRIHVGLQYCLDAAPAKARSERAFP